MVSESLKLSSQNQITLPATIRKALKLRPGSYISVVLEGKSVRIYKLGESWADNTKGIAKTIYAKSGGGKKYLREERKTWDEK